MAPSTIRSHHMGLSVAGLALVAAVAVGGAHASHATTSALAPSTTQNESANASNGYGFIPSDQLAPDTSRYNGRGRGSAGNSGAVAQAPQINADATATQVSGIVDIVTTVNFNQGEAAGTGMILTSNGTILTNNHVVEGATSIEVTVLSSGDTYQATVVGSSPTQDVAVLQLADASGLPTAKLGSSADVQVGDAVVGVGNAGNAEGTSASPGNVVALGQQITATDESGGNAETLTDLIKTDAAIQAGDSGGPLYANDGTIIGIDTAAESSGGSSVAGYAIPIDKALSIARQIVDGVDNETIQQGVPAFLGVELAPNATGAAIAGVVTGSAADQAGLTGGDTITTIGGTAVSDAAAISQAIASHDVGDRVTIEWTDSVGQSHTETVTLGAGPAD